jgi:hypothetical protein
MTFGWKTKSHPDLVSKREKPVKWVNSHFLWYYVAIKKPRQTTSTIPFMKHHTPDKMKPASIPPRYRQPLSIIRAALPASINGAASMTAMTRNGIDRAGPPASRFANEGFVYPSHSQPECTSPAPVNPKAMIVKNVSYVIVGHPRIRSLRTEKTQTLLFFPAGPESLASLIVLAQKACNRHTSSVKQSVSRKTGNWFCEQEMRQQTECGFVQSKP